MENNINNKIIHLPEYIIIFTLNELNKGGRCHFISTYKRHADRLRVFVDVEENRRGFTVGFISGVLCSVF